MKILTGTSIKRFWLILPALLAALVFGCRCSTSKQAHDPLAGWHSIGFDSKDVNKIIRDDYQDYIKQNNMVGYAGPVQFFEDGTGQHAVNFEAFEHSNNASWRYVIIYNKENKRVDVIKYNYAKHQS